MGEAEWKAKAAELLSNLADVKVALVEVRYLLVVVVVHARREARAIAAERGVVQVRASVVLLLPVVGLRRRLEERIQHLFSDSNQPADLGRGWARISTLAGLLLVATVAFLQTRSEASPGGRAVPRRRRRGNRTVRCRGARRFHRAPDGDVVRQAVLGRQIKQYGIRREAGDHQRRRRNRHRGHERYGARPL